MTLTRFLLAGAAMGVCVWAQAATFLVDDSQTTVLEPSLGMHWRSFAPAAGDHQVQGQTRVQVRLDTRAWAGKPARIYMALPTQAGAPVQAQWQAQSGMLAGQLRSGQRGLVWAGTVPGALLEDVLTVTVQADGRLLSAPQLLRFYFEIDLP